MNDSTTGSVTGAMDAAGAVDNVVDTISLGNIDDKVTDFVSITEPQAPTPEEPREPETQVQEPAPEEPQEPETQEPEIDYKKQYEALLPEYTRSRQEIAALKTKSTALEKYLAKVQVEIPLEKQQELELLSKTNPEAWRQQINAIEAEHAKSISSEIAKEVEIARREAVLAEYNSNSPQHLQINNHVFNYVLPAGITGKLQRGEVDFESFLKEANNYLKNISRKADGTPQGPGNTPKAGKTAPIKKTNGGAEPPAPPSSLPDDFVW